MRVLVARAARATIDAATTAALPKEACGLLFGRRDARHLFIHEASVAANVASEPWHRFEIDPAHLFKAQRSARNGGPAILGVWHSHPGGPATPSARDLAGVTDRAWLWLIAVPEGGRVQLAAHLPDASGAGGFREIACLDETGSRR